MLRAIALLVGTAAFAAAPALAWPGPPRAAAPKPAQLSGPPPLWAETQTTSLWLAFGSYCWRTGCADYIPPPQRAGLPLLTIARGAAIRFHLGFTPTQLRVRLFPSRRLVRLAATTVASWRPATAGVASVEARGSGGSASYVVRIRLR